MGFACHAVQKKQTSIPLYRATTPPSLACSFSHFTQTLDALRKTNSFLSALQALACILATTYISPAKHARVFDSLQPKAVPSSPAPLSCLQIIQGFTVDGWLNDIDEEDSFVDKCIWVEGQDKPTTVMYGGREVESSLIGTVIEDMRIQNCGCVEKLSTDSFCLSVSVLFTCDTYCTGRVFSILGRWMERIIVGAEFRDCFFMLDYYQLHEFLVLPPLFRKVLMFHGCEEPCNIGSIFLILKLFVRPSSCFFSSYRVARVSMCRAGWSASA